MTSVLRGIFGPKGDEVMGSLREPRNEELHNLCSSPSIYRLKKSRRMIFTGHVAEMNKKEK
jgi:hypothetical protein